MAIVGSGRKRVTTKLYSAEDQALDQIARETGMEQQEAMEQLAVPYFRNYRIFKAEARLAARRQARAEAREIRMRELEKQQKEADQQSERHYELLSDPVRGRSSREGRSLMSGTPSYTSSRRNSEDSTEAVDNSRELKHQLQDLEEKFKMAMVSNAQLDNEKSTLTYNVDTLKDEIEELEEKFIQIQKEHKDKSRAYDELNRDFKEIKEEIGFLRESLSQRDELIEIYRLKFELEEEKQKTAKMEQLTLVHGPQSNGPEMKLLEVQREANKQVSDYKFKLKKAEQESSALQSSVSRLESQVIRYKTAAENAEKVEDELKAEKRKLQREVREAQAKIEELETANAHIQKRIDKLKSARNALVK
ncbi:leucine-rich repeat flightless-interacting protein 2-like isoform X10 [Tachypleus tridentatus]|uniref:leucine-rich repeat flightless-interacting protein 2-like isoform X10 n=1 Tax=Tachypleus tridentatus TaxID=6853 RepID=UPI003FD190D0